LNNNVTLKSGLEVTRCFVADQLWLTTRIREEEECIIQLASVSWTNYY